jgi:hypothetical protein
MPPRAGGKLLAIAVKLEETGIDANGGVGALRFAILPTAKEPQRTPQFKLQRVERSAVGCLVGGLASGTIQKTDRFLMCISRIECRIGSAPWR